MSSSSSSSSSSWEQGKVFVGGISWETSEERLKEYFSSFGQVLEAVIVKDRSTGRARGFGFVAFSDPIYCSRRRNTPSTAEL